MIEYCSWMDSGRKHCQVIAGQETLDLGQKWEEVYEEEELHEVERDQADCFGKFWQLGEAVKAKEPCLQLWEGVCHWPRASQGGCTCFWSSLESGSKGVDRRSRVRVTERFGLSGLRGFQIICSKFILLINHKHCWPHWAIVQKYYNCGTYNICCVFKQLQDYHQQCDTWMSAT